MPITGIIENMSSFICPTCGSLHEIFKSGKKPHLTGIFPSWDDFPSIPV
ncbi:P-loop NTPase [Pelorhabdus rhamnosifermentans]